MTTNKSKTYGKVNRIYLNHPVIENVTLCRLIGNTYDVSIIFDTEDLELVKSLKPSILNRSGKPTYAIYRTASKQTRVLGISILREYDDSILETNNMDKIHNGSITLRYLNHNKFDLRKSNICMVKGNINSKTFGISNAKSHPNICIITYDGTKYWNCSVSYDGKRHCKSYSIKKFSDAGAKQLAIEWVKNFKREHNIL